MSNQNSFISPIVLTGPYFDESSIAVCQSAVSSGSISCSVGLDIPENLVLSHEGSAYVLNHAMKIDIAIQQDSDDPGSKADLMRIALTATGAVSVADSIGLNEGEISEALRLNAISLFYSSARSYVEMITAQSSIGRFTIPAIDPNAYVRSLDSEA